MASVSQSSVTGSGGEPRVRHERVGPDDRREALAVLLTGQPGLDDAAVEQFLRFSRSQRFGLDELWLARVNERPAAATLLVPCPGRTAMQFVSPAEHWHDAEIAAELVRLAATSQDPSKVRLIQSLLDPDQPRTRQVLRRAGFRDLAVLVYMQSRSAESASELALDREGFRVLHWSEGNREAFARAILATYEQTLDCPGLLGLREIGDIIAGHMAAGVFRPDLWTAVYDDDRPVGVMLLNELPHSDALELVYLGLAVPYRGRGLARRLLSHALGRLRRERRSSLILAVDEHNEPAVKLYRGMGFQATGRKRAMIFTPPGAPRPSRD